MAYKTVFLRYELKYLLTEEQKIKIFEAIKPYMLPDKYGRSTIRNIYFDTDSYRLIRRSMEKPAYKEKLRIRSYSQATPDTTVFVELKKKYDGIVYKRRLSLSEKEAVEWLGGERPCPKRTQISAEIDYFLKYYGTLRPTVFLSYEREAYCQKDGGELRITFDENILCRTNELSLEANVGGDSILSVGKTLMEIKCAGGMPLWLARVLSSEHISKTSFSKYGTAYEKLIFPDISNTHQEERNTVYGKSF